jgi:hypothetical protein
MFLGASKGGVVVVLEGGYIESSPPPALVQRYEDSSDIESDAGSVDSIKGNANFVSF